MDEPVKDQPTLSPAPVVDKPTVSTPVKVTITDANDKVQPPDHQLAAATSDETADKITVTATPPAASEPTPPEPVAAAPVLPADPKKEALLKAYVPPTADVPAPDVPILPPKHSRNLPLGAIAAAVVITVGLAAGVVYTYVRSQVTTPTTAKTSQTPTPAIAKPATAQDVDTTSQDIDQAIAEIKETQDLSSADLTDASLGL